MLTAAGQAWTLSTVRAILANPRYTGRQVWNRQPSAMDLIDPANTGLGHQQVQRRGLPDGWVISGRPAHPALVSEQDFIAVQGIRAAREGTDAKRRLPAVRAAALRDLRTPGRVVLVEQPARLPVPPRAFQRLHAGPRPAEEPVHPRGPHPAAPARLVRAPDRGRA